MVAVAVVAVEVVAVEVVAVVAVAARHLVVVDHLPLLRLVEHPLVPLLELEEA